MSRLRGLSSENARQVRQRGHDDALEFALAIGLNKDYKNDPHAKKDVIDLAGDAHSVKSGEKKWQIFLYGLNRFESDEAFMVMNGIGELLAACIKAFPPTFEAYESDKSSAKERLRKPMRELALKLQSPHRVKAFMSKAMFNGGEVNYLTVKHNGLFHVFWGKEVVQTFADNLEVTNSRALAVGQLPEQKVLFKYQGLNLAELEMRNDSAIHYREIRFNMLKPKALNLLFVKITAVKKFNDKVYLYGQAQRRFGRG